MNKISAEVLASADRIQSAYRINLSEAELRTWARDAVKVIRVLQASPQPAGVRVKGLPPEPQRPRLDNSEQKFGSCEYCDQRRNLGRDENGALICGPCADEAYLSEWMAYGRALQQALSAQPQKEEAAGWMVERPLRDGGTHLYLPFLHTREEMERYAKANSHETLVALYRSTPVQVQESQTVSEEMILVSREDLAQLLARPKHGWVDAKDRLSAALHSIRED